MKFSIDSPNHCNGDKLVVTSIYTTGPDPIGDELIELVLIPLDRNYQPEGNSFLDLYLSPSRMPAEAPTGLLGAETWNSILRYGLNYEKGFKVFEDWYDRLKLKDNKRIVLVGMNAGITLTFLQSWLTFDLAQFYVRSYVRDITSIMLWENDLAERCASNFIPFPQIGQLGTYLKRLEVDYDYTMVKNLLYRTNVIAQGYGKFLKDCTERTIPRTRSFGELEIVLEGERVPLDEVEDE